MDFRLTEEQDGFAQSLTELMAKADSVAVARAWADGDAEPGLALWRRLADQGVNALVVPEEQGGLGGTSVDLVVAFEVLGHQLAVGPWIESAAYLASALDGDDLAAVAEGAVATVVVPPLVPYALDADVAEKVYVPVGGGGFETLVPRSSTTGAVLRSVDTTRRLFDVSTPAAPHPSTAFDLAVLACSAELLGCGERLLADSVEYVQQRKQYGRTIGSYQAIKHALADVRIALDFARPLVLGAALADEDRSRAVSAAKVAAGDAAYLASRVALQVHGAIGYTAEFDLGLWINRVRALVGAWGGSAYHRGRIADSLAQER
jgi:alkylation response protein AidB-like acyl-CoA dehydrogenase